MKVGARRIKRAEEDEHNEVFWNDLSVLLDLVLGEIKIE